jgi:hypothetical protein
VKPEGSFQRSLKAPSLHVNTTKMRKFRHYSPEISRFLVSVLYHEAKARKIPMTKLTDLLLRQALQGTEGWKTAESLGLTTATPTTPQPKAA